MSWFHFRLATSLMLFVGSYLRYDEGTAFMPVIEKKRQLPQSDKYPFMALDEDGFDLPSDWLVPATFSDITRRGAEILIDILLHG